MHQIIKISVNFILLIAAVLFLSELECKPILDAPQNGEIENQIEVATLKGKAQFRPLTKKDKKLINDDDDHQRVKNFFIKVKPFSLGKNNIELSFLLANVENPLFELSHVFAGRAPPYNIL